MKWKKYKIWILYALCFSYPALSNTVEDSSHAFEEEVFQFVNHTPYAALIKYTDTFSFLRKGREVKTNECLWILKSEFEHLSILLMTPGRPASLFFCGIAEKTYHTPKNCIPHHYTLTTIEFADHSCANTSSSSVRSCFLEEYPLSIFQSTILRQKEIIFTLTPQTTPQTAEILTPCELF